MYCIKCGTNNPSDAKFCNVCGQEILHNTGVSQPIQPETTRQNINTSNYKPPSTKNSFLVVLAMLGIIGIFALLVYWDQYDLKKGDSLSSSSGSNNEYSSNTYSIPSSDNNSSNTYSTPSNDNSSNNTYSSTPNTYSSSDLSYYVGTWYQLSLSPDIITIYSDGTFLANGSYAGNVTVLDEGLKFTSGSEGFILYFETFMGYEALVEDNFYSRNPENTENVALYWQGDSAFMRDEQLARTLAEELYEGFYEDARLD